MRRTPRVPIDLADNLARRLESWQPIPPTLADAREVAAGLNRDLELTGEDRFRAATVLGWWTDEAPTDEERREGLASSIVRDVTNALNAPGPRSWRRRKVVRRVSSFLYGSGITRSGGGCSSGGVESPGGLGWIYHLPRWQDVLPRRGGTLRPYVLWKTDTWWHCQLSQGLKVRGRHRPQPAAVFGICGACIPWPCCGAAGWDHAESCTADQRAEVLR